MPRRAILLAAGVGRRLAPLTDTTPKALLPVDDAGTLLDRHLAALRGAGIDEAHVVTGHLREVLVTALDNVTHPRITLYPNERFEEGSILSLRCAADVLAQGALVMDADVLYPASFLTRLVASPHANCFLLDADCARTGEEMLLGVRDASVHEIGRPLTRGPYDLTGEGVGFAKLSPEAGAGLTEIMNAMVTAGATGAEYEAALDRLVQETPFGYEAVSGEPWTEIDFPGDMTRARDVVWPAIRRIESGG